MRFSSSVKSLPEVLVTSTEVCQSCHQDASVPALAVPANSIAIISKDIFMIVAANRIPRQACPCGKTFQTSRRQARTCRHYQDTPDLLE
jgi:hypothetical protein